MTKFNIELARIAADHMVLAYKKGDEFVLPKGSKLIEDVVDEKTDTRVLLLRRDNMIVIAFRGTASLKNVLTDIKIRRIKYPKRRLWFRKYRCHFGFANTYKTVRDDIIRLFKTNLNKNDEILVTGHSLGGALATICALDLKRSQKLKNNVYHYNFGSPMVGNDHFTGVFNKHVKHSFRIVNDEDIVPQSPPGGYDHVNTYVLIDEGQKIIVKPNILDRIEKRFEGTTGVLTGKALKAHSSDGYRDYMYNLPPP